MTKIKLKEWAERHNLSYLTANRHFHAGMIPGAVQLDSGTILVEDDSLEQTMAATSNNDAMSLFLKKTVEFSKNNSTVEDFAAYIISNFQLKLNTSPESPRYSKNKPKSEEVQKHFQQFILDKDSQDHMKAVKASLKEQTGAVTSTQQAAELSEVLGEVTPFSRVKDVDFGSYDEFKDFMLDEDSDDEPTVGGLITRSVDLNSTPQQINYTGSIGQTSNSSSLVSNEMPWGPTSVSALSGDPNISWGPASASFVTTNTTSTAFQPTQRELQSVTKVIETADNLPRKRGRKPSKKR